MPCYGHVLRVEDGHILKSAFVFDIEDQGKEGWMEKNME